MNPHSCQNFCFFNCFVVFGGYEFNQYNSSYHWPTEKLVIIPNRAVTVKIVIGSTWWFLFADTDYHFDWSVLFVVRYESVKRYMTWNSDTMYDIYGWSFIIRMRTYTLSWLKRDALYGICEGRMWSSECEWIYVRIHHYISWYVWVICEVLLICSKNVRHIYHCT